MARTGGRKMKISLIRKQEHENDGSSVKYWAEDVNNGIIASLIDGYFPNEMNLRISIRNDTFEIRGHRSIMGTLNYDEFEKRANMHIERHLWLKKIKVEKN